ncbi:hypothetical protein D3H64_05640 [Atopobacter sp. AH10]|uniref:hypothetical protein n=1 Tax=Atopobacter sp. AH10 TaxID=2315861 RepID=UPI000EF25860|nr:hypothetical protein [Atopobacter sp. AH10]RLK63267.1 hypothetical protein D3H64_05640 [Atopobacter sp. AH10]
MGKTGKSFIDYNVYHDRPFGVKWGTAYAMEELLSAIELNHQEAIAESSLEPAMSEEELDQLLTAAYLKGEGVVVYLLEKDELDHHKKVIIGEVRGKVSADQLMIGDQLVDFEDIYRVERLK